MFNILGYVLFIFSFTFLSYFLTSLWNWCESLSSCCFVLKECRQLILLNSTASLPVHPPWSLSSSTFTPHWKIPTLLPTHLLLERFLDADCPFIRFAQQRAPNSLLIPPKFTFLKSSSLTLQLRTPHLISVVTHTMMNVLGLNLTCYVTWSPSQWLNEVNE